MAESAEEIYRRADEAAGPDGRLPMPPVEEWETFPFEGEIRVRELQPPVAEEPPRMGEDPADCWRCERGDAGALWSDDRWRLVSLPRPSGLPVIVILESRQHVDLGDLDDDSAADLGRMVVRVERAVARLDGIGRVHVGRWGDGSAHFHIWFLARPARLLQLKGSFAAIWDDILPPVPEEIWRENLAVVAEILAEGGGQLGPAHEALKMPRTS